MKEKIVSVVKKMFFISLTLCICISNVCLENAYCDEMKENASDENINIQAESAVLVEATTGQIIYEKEADKQLAPASVTKVMTLLLIFEAIDEGKIKLDDIVTTSEYASSMGGSQVFLEAMEEQSVDTMIKCIAVASANDACVAMAEHIAGTEEAFVAKMNEKAKALGMNNTNFVNCCGLDVDGHITTARDISLMSRELINNHPKIFDYTKIWMENITHVTKKGTSEFGLTNTNKLMKQYPYATGLKTGSTSKAKFCVSATASKEGVNLIAVIMAAPDYKARFKDASTLLDYGFANCALYVDEKMPQLKEIEVKGGTKSKIKIQYSNKFSYLDMNGMNFSNIESKVVMREVSAPVEKGDTVGEIDYYYNKDKIGSVDIIALENVEKSGFMESLSMILDIMFT